MPLIYLGWEFICVVRITLLCVQPIPILSDFFLCHLYIPLSNLFTCLTEHPDATASPYDMVQEIVYLDIVIQESLRLYPPAPATTRYCNETTTIGQVTLPKGAQVTIPIWHIHYDPQYWPQPDKFDPNRYEV